MKLFPKEDDFDSAFLYASKGAGVPVAILKGLAAAESAFNPNAYRAEPQIKDASRGLIQILLKTAQGVGFRGKPEQLFDPKTNLLYGAKYIRGHLAKYPDVTQAIASYNMGYPRPASKTTPLITKLYGVPKPGWVFANQPYVDRVSSYIAYYQAKEAGDTKRAQLVYDTIKKKDLTSARHFLKNPILAALPQCRVCVKG